MLAEEAPPTEERVREAAAGLVATRGGRRRRKAAVQAVAQAFDVWVQGMASRGSSPARRTRGRGAPARCCGCWGCRGIGGCCGSWDGWRGQGIAGVGVGPKAVDVRARAGPVPSAGLLLPATGASMLGLTWFLRLRSALPRAEGQQAQGCRRCPGACCRACACSPRGWVPPPRGAPPPLGLPRPGGPSGPGAAPVPVLARLVLA